MRPHRQASPEPGSQCIPPARKDIPRHDDRTGRRADRRHHDSDRQHGDIQMDSRSASKHSRTRDPTTPAERARILAARRRGNASRPNLEVLEDRCLLSFSPAVSYPVGANPQAVVTADFNGDGRLDLAVANSGSSTVSVLLGNAERHVPAGPELRHRRRPAVAGGRRLQRRRQARPRDRQRRRRERAAGQRQRHLPGPRPASASARARRPWRWATSTATASSTSA